jgi:hypothetical protein
MTCAPLPTVPSSAMVLARGLSSVSVRAIERMRQAVGGGAPFDGADDMNEAPNPVPVRVRPIVRARWVYGRAANTRPITPPPVRRSIVWVEWLAYGSLVASLVLLASMVARVRC